MRINVGLFPGVRISVSLEREVLPSPSGVGRPVGVQAEALPDRVSWLCGHIYRIVEGRMVVDPLSESEAIALDLSRSELFQVQSHQT
jgi:hypothetical protein